MYDISLINKTQIDLAYKDIIIFYHYILAMEDETDTYSGELYVEPDDLIFNVDKDNEIYSGGFNVHSVLLKNGLSPILSLNLNDTQHGGYSDKVSDLFHSLAIPNWVVSYNSVGGKKHKTNHALEEGISNEDDDIEDELYEKLLSLASAELPTKPKQEKKSSHKFTKKQKKHLKKLTKRRK
jgi:hypothetical protein